MVKRHRASRWIGCMFGSMTAAALLAGSAGCCPNCGSLDGGPHCKRLDLGRAFDGMNCCSSCMTVKNCPHCPPREGCSSEEDWCDYGDTQVQFYSPPGAHVTVGGLRCVLTDQRTRSHDIADYGSTNNRLEQNPEQYAVFNLKPGRQYEFKYALADGLPGVTVYGELDVKCARSKEAKMYQRRGFIPISLPSEYYKRMGVNNPEIYPYRPESARTAIDSYDVERLKQGDVIEKVFFVADLSEADEHANNEELRIARLERQLEWVDAKFHCAYLDFYSDPCACCNDVCCKSFIGWDQKRVKIKQELASLRATRTGDRRLLAGDHVLTRRGMLVLATSDTIKAHQDPERAAGEVGEVLLVMRIGGRHFHWGQPDQVQLAQENCAEGEAPAVDVQETVTQ